MTGFNDLALRGVSGDVGVHATGESLRAVAVNGVVEPHTLTVDETPAHNHATWSIGLSNVTRSSGGTRTLRAFESSISSAQNAPNATEAVGAGEPHGLGLTIDPLAIRTIDVIVAERS